MKPEAPHQFTCKGQALTKQRSGVVSSSERAESRVREREACKLVLIDGVDGFLVGGGQLHGLLGELIVEVADVVSRFNLGLEWGRDLTALQLVPLDRCKERMRLDVPLSSRRAAKALGNGLGHEALADCHRITREPGGVGHILVKNHVKEIVFIVGFEGRLSGKHLVHEHAQGPPVHTGAVRLFLDDLRSNVVGSAAESVGGVDPADAFLAHAEISHLDVAIRVEHDVVELEITVDHTALVQEQQCTDDFGRIEARARLIELAGTLDLEHQITAVHVLHHKVETVGCLEARVQLRQEGMLAGQLENALFRHCALDIVILDDHVLLQHLDGVNLIGALAFSKHDFAKAALAQHLDILEVSGGHLRQHSSSSSACGLARGRRHHGWLVAEGASRWVRSWSCRLGRWRGHWRPLSSWCRCWSSLSGF
eukprot:m.755144 g.755144  ORF g.755144 m.755144 type:complete len:424 (+) comp59009_c0_seq1:1115-2386(+)